MATGTLEAYEATKIKDVTYFHPVGAAIFFLCCLISVSIPRKKAIIPFLLILLIIPMNQVIAILSLDFNFARILVIVYLVRLFLRSEVYPLRKNAIDKALLLFILFLSLVYVAQWHTVKAIVYRAGYALDVIGSYVVFRSLVRDYEDLDTAIKALAAASVVLAVAVVIEQSWQSNIFHHLGPISESVIFREGKVRSVGSFGHYIYIGTFGAHVFPLFASLITHKRKTAIAGMVASSVIVYCSSSSGPVLGYLSGIGALLLYGIRRYMRVLRWALLAIVVVLHLVMKGPVWSLLNKASVFAASTSYHRFLLVDQFIRRFGEWFLLGTKSTGHWSEYLSMWDITNEYVAVGVEGGLISLVVFVILIALCFKSVGRAMLANTTNAQRSFTMWCVGASIFSDCVSFMGVTYLGQILVLFFLSVATVSMFRDVETVEGDPES